MIHTLLAGATAALLVAAPDPRAQAVIDTAATRMGGLATLRSVERLHLETMVAWYHHTVAERAPSTVSSYERNTELRDYRVPAWRNSRRFFSPNGVVEVTDLVADSVAAVQRQGKWQPQNVAYVGERNEVFTFAPERLIPQARDAADLRALPDTTIDGIPLARVTATVGPFTPTLYVSRRDGFLSRVSYRAAQPNDFGLAPWGEMDVTIRYSRWTKAGPAGPVLPMQLDVDRVGHPYKRVTVISATVNGPIAADSLAISDSLRAAFLGTARKPMHDVPLDGARVTGDFAVFGAPGTPAGAVRIGGRWIIVEAGTAPLSIERSAAFLRRADPATPIGGAILSAAHAGAVGGAAWLVRTGVTTWVAGAATPFVRAALHGRHVADAAVTTVQTDTWIPLGDDSVRVERVDLPDYPGTPVVYVPALRWAYAWTGGPVQVDRLLAHIRHRGWQVDRLGNIRNIAGVPLP